MSRLRPTPSQQALFDYCRSLPTALTAEAIARIRERIVIEQERRVEADKWMLNPRTWSPPLTEQQIKENAEYIAKRNQF